MQTVHCPHCGNSIYIQVNGHNNVIVSGTISQEEMLKNVKVNISAPTELDIAKAKYEHTVKTGKPILEQPEKGIIYHPDKIERPEVSLTEFVGLFSVVSGAIILLLIIFKIIKWMQNFRCYR